jgi:uncharacterized protein (TIGR03437 family)
MKTDLRFWPAALLLGLLPASAAFAAAPVIQGVVNGANFTPGFASATFITITGTNLASSTANWSVFTNGNLPTSLGGVGVTINNIPAYIAFVSPGQINALAPDDPTTGSVPVVVTNSLGVSNTFQATKQTAAPALFAYSQQGGFFAVVEAPFTYQLVAPPGLFGKTPVTVQAAPGETLTLYGTGFGPVTPAQPTGQLVTTPAPLANPVTVTIGGQSAAVQFAGLIGSGLYQINVTVPQVASGNQLIAMSVAGTKAANQPYVPIQLLPSQMATAVAPTLVNCLTGQVDYMTYQLGHVPFSVPVAASIGGTQLCSTCQVLPPTSEQFATRMENSIKYKESVKACYDQTGTIYTLEVVHP